LYNSINFNHAFFANQFSQVDRWSIALKLLMFPELRWQLLKTKVVLAEGYGVKSIVTEKVDANTLLALPQTVAFTSAALHAC
jgi:hypothetical protein